MINSHRTEARPGHNYVKPSYAPLLLAALASVAPNQPAASQQNATAAPKPAGTEIAPRGQREVKDIAYGDWKKLCFKPGGAKMICRTSITGTFATGQMAVRVDIVEREGDGNARLQVFSPVGMYLPKPVKITIDQGEPHSVPYTWCLTNACIAGAVADPKMIEEMACRADAATGIRGFQPPDAHDVAAARSVRVDSQGRAGTNLRTGHR